MIIFYSVIIGLLNWTIFVEQLNVCCVSPHEEPIPAMMVINRCSDEPYYLAYDDYMCRADA